MQTMTHARAGVTAGACADERVPAEYDYARFSQITGPLTAPPEQGAPVRYRRLPEVRALRTVLGAAVVMATQAAFVAWIMLPRHYPLHAGSPLLATSSLVMLVSIGLIELFRCMNVLPNAHATPLARDPVPVVAGDRHQGRLPHLLRARARSRWRW